MFGCVHTFVLVCCQEQAAAHLESGGDVKMLLHVGAQHLTDAALPDLLVVKRGISLSLCTNIVSAWNSTAQLVAAYVVCAEH